VLNEPSVPPVEPRRFADVGVVAVLPTSRDQAYEE
jgi:hypothetical protein